ncbi:MAG: DUF58 domain-containing protein [Bacillota bacterium]|nr:DUF58 domain-containing protein [Bacillota bacterium]
MKKHWKAFKNSWKILVLFILIFSTFSYAMFQGGFVSWFLFYSFLPFAIYAVAVLIYPLKGFEVTRNLVKTEYNAGEPLKAFITIRRRSSFPLFYLLVEDQIGQELLYSHHEKKAKSLLFPLLKKEVTTEFVIQELPRGEHVLRGFQLRIGDLLGLIEKEYWVENEDKIIVYPAYSEILYRPFENHFDQGMTASRERVQRDTSMAIGVREYQPGDRFSWINWKATARQNDIMTKEFEQRQSHDVFVVMDCFPHSNFEGAVSFSASLLRAIIKKGAEAGFLTHSNERVSFPIRGGDKQLQNFFYHLAKISPKSTTPLDRIIESETFFIQQAVSYMLVTSSISEPLIEKASILGQRKGSVTIFLIKGEKESPTKEELSLKAVSTARGVKLVLVHEGNFAQAFSEVRMR